jgi:hypothetical protein
MQTEKKRGGARRKKIQWPNFFIFKRGLLNFIRNQCSFKSHGGNLYPHRTPQQKPQRLCDHQRRSNLAIVTSGNNEKEDGRIGRQKIWFGTPPCRPRENEAGPKLFVPHAI